MEKASSQRAESRLIVTADDYGYARGYDAGILAASMAGAVDAVSVMVRGAGGAIGGRPSGSLSAHGHDPDALMATGIEIGLHLVLGPELLGGGRAGPAARDAALTELDRQLGEFGRLYNRPPAFVDGHRHCHAAPGLGAAIARTCADHGLPLRSVSGNHRRTLRCLGVATQDRLIGRLDEHEPLPPPEIAKWLETGSGPPGVTEWMVHPGHADTESGSSYDAGRVEDLELVLRLAREPVLAAARSTHADALT
ncbi:MAG: ChbG/HpnK family deacetylase [Solirubrobacterales bacterium]